MPIGNNAHTRANMSQAAGSSPHTDQSRARSNDPASSRPSSPALPTDTSRWIIDPSTNHYVDLPNIVDLESPHLDVVTLSPEQQQNQTEARASDRDIDLTVSRPSSPAPPTGNSRWIIDPSTNHYVDLPHIVDLESPHLDVATLSPEQQQNQAEARASDRDIDAMSLSSNDVSLSDDEMLIDSNALEIEKANEILCLEKWCDQSQEPEKSSRKKLVEYIRNNGEFQPYKHLYNGSEKTMWLLDEMTIDDDTHPGLTTLPPNLVIDTLTCNSASITALPEDLTVENILDLDDCYNLSAIPKHTLETINQKVIALETLEELESNAEGVIICIQSSGITIEEQSEICRDYPRLFSYILSDDNQDPSAIERFQKLDDALQFWELDTKIKDNLVKQLTEEEPHGPEGERLKFEYGLPQQQLNRFLFKLRYHKHVSSKENKEAFFAQLHSILTDMQKDKPTRDLYIQIMANSNEACADAALKGFDQLYMQQQIARARQAQNPEVELRKLGEKHALLEYVDEKAEEKISQLTAENKPNVDKEQIVIAYRANARKTHELLIYSECIFFNNVEHVEEKDYQALTEDLIKNSKAIIEQNAEKFPALLAFLAERDSQNLQYQNLPELVLDDPSKKAVLRAAACPLSGGVGPEHEDYDEKEENGIKEPVVIDKEGHDRDEVFEYGTLMTCWTSAELGAKQNPMNKQAFEITDLRRVNMEKLAQE